MYAESNSVTPDEIEQLIKANIDKAVTVVYVDGKTQDLFVHSVGDEGFVCDIARETSQPPSFAYWVRFTDVREARAAEKDCKYWLRYYDVMNLSTKLIQLKDNEGALRLLDDAIATAIGEQANRWVLILCQHAAVISKFLGNLPRVKHYYEKSLEFNPENGRALAGLADVAKKQGELASAKQYMARYYNAPEEDEDFLKKERLETLLKKWPEFS